MALAALIWFIACIYQLHIDIIVIYCILQTVSTLKILCLNSCFHFNQCIPQVTCSVEKAG